LSQASGLLTSITLQIVLVSQSTRHLGSFNALKMTVRKDTVTMSGEQILEDANPYKEKELRRYLPVDVLVNTSLTSIRSRSLTIQDKEHAEALVIDTEARRRAS
jgi:hypothetical protein